MIHDPPFTVPIIPFYNFASAKGPSKFNVFTDFILDPFLYSILMAPLFHLKAILKAS
jgi:hypothetical protein